MSGDDDPPGWVRLVGPERVRRHGTALFARLVPLGAVLITASLILLFWTGETRGSAGPVVAGATVEGLVGVGPTPLVAGGLALGTVAAVVGYALGTAADALASD